MPCFDPKLLFHEKKPPRKILIVRSARKDLLEDLFEDVHAVFPQVEIGLLTQESLKEEFLKRKSIAHVVSIPDGPFKLANIDPSLVRTLKDRSYDCSLLLLNNVRGEGYFSFRLILFLAGIPNKLEYNIHRQLKRSGFKICYPLLSKIVGVLKKIVGRIFYSAVMAVWKIKAKQF